MKPTLSVAIITYNEAANLPRCLASVSFADEVIVVDQGSQDDTVHIAKEAGAKVIHQEWLGFGQQKNVAIEHCTSQWILSLDADEVITSALHREIERTLEKGEADGYFIPRLPYIGKIAIHHSGWYPDLQLRLVKQQFAKFEDKPVHERMLAPAKTTNLKQAMDHYTYRDLRHWFEKFNRYTSEDAKHGNFSLARLLIKPPLASLRTYFLWQGFRDGIMGLTIAMSDGLYAFLTEVKRYEREHQ